MRDRARGNPVWSHGDPPVNWMIDTHTTENITFSQLCWRTVVRVILWTKLCHMRLLLEISPFTKNFGKFFPCVSNLLVYGNVTCKLLLFSAILHILNTCAQKLCFRNAAYFYHLDINNDFYVLVSSAYPFQAKEANWENQLDTFCSDQSKTKTKAKKDTHFASAFARCVYARLQAYAHNLHSSYGNPQ